MEKVLKHFKNNALIYLILLTCLIVILIAVFHKEDEEVKYVDTSVFNTITLDEAIGLFDDDTPKYLLVSSNDCGATVNYVPSLQYVMMEYEYKVHFLSLDKINFKRDKEKLTKLGELFNTEYTHDGVTKPLVEFFEGSDTPISILIKNKKVVYVFMGTMNVSTLETISKAYGLGEKNA